MLFAIFSLPQGISCLLHKHFSIATAKACLLVALLSTTGHAAFAGDWQLKKNSSGIKIYTQSSQNTEFKAIRAEFEAKGNVRQLANLLTDVSRQKNWVYSTSNSAIIKRPRQQRTLLLYREGYAMAVEQPRCSCANEMGARYSCGHADGKFPQYR